MNNNFYSVLLFILASLLGLGRSSILLHRDPLECPSGYGPSIDGLNCVKKIILPSRKPCESPVIRHGDYELQLGGRMAKFWCEDGRSLVPSNASYAMCSAFGFWDREHPKCVLTQTGGCGDLPEEDHLTAFKIPATEAIVYGFVCDAGYDLIGPRVISCNGALWNGTVPGCVKRLPPVTPPREESLNLREAVKEAEEVDSKENHLPEENTKKRSHKPKRLSEYSLSVGTTFSSSSLCFILLLTNLLLRL